MNTRAEQRFKPGAPVVVAADSPIERFSTVFEDDGQTGYFYAYDSRSTTNPILDAVHIYNVSAVVDRHIDSVAEILWSADGLKSALFINGYPHAVFDFAAKRGYCRNNAPNLPQANQGDWNGSTHEWDDSVMLDFQPSGRDRS